MALPTTLATLSGRDLAHLRVCLNLSLRAVAQELGTTHPVVKNWETSLSPVEPERLGRWLAALRAAAEKRSRQLASQGFSPRELRMSPQQALRQLELATPGGSHQR